MAIISLKQQTKRLQIESFETDNEILFNYFDKLPTGERDDKFFKALYIGVLAMLEDRLSAFLSKTTNELGTELESLKIIFEMKKELFYKSTIKGTLAEDEIAEFLENFLQEQKIKDTISLTGSNAGKIPKNKTGDILALIDGMEDKKIAIECKFDKSIKLGDITSKDVFTKKFDTAWSQLIEAQANRDGKAGIIVFDISLVDNSILNLVQNVRFIPAVGFVAIIDSNKGDYNNLAIAYMLARDIVMNSHEVSLDKDILAILINRIIKDVKDTLSVRDMVKANIDNNMKILMQLEKSLIMMEFTQKYLLKFLSDGQISKEDLLNFYLGDGIKEQFKPVELEIKGLI